MLASDVLFPPLAHFLHKSKLPTIRSVLGVVRNLTTKKCEQGVAIREVVKLVYSKWFHDTVYCLSLRTMERRLTELWKVFKDGKHSLGKGKWDTVKVVRLYKEMVESADTLWDVYAKDDKRWKECEKEWGVRMSDMEQRYYEDQKGPRLLECDKGVDPVWYTAVMKEAEGQGEVGAVQGG